MRTWKIGDNTYSIILCENLSFRLCRVDKGGYVEIVKDKIFSSIDDAYEYMDLCVDADKIVLNGDSMELHAFNWGDIPTEIDVPEIAENAGKQTADVAITNAITIASQLSEETRKNGYKAIAYALEWQLTYLRAAQKNIHGGIVK